MTFVHCSAGAFNYTKVVHEPPRPIFTERKITIQDVYGTPGFCFVGSVIAKLEVARFAVDKYQGMPLTDEMKNRMCRAPAPKKDPSCDDSGSVRGALGKDHGLVQRCANLFDWYEIAGLGPWLHGEDGDGTSSQKGSKPHRLFNLNHLSKDEAERMVRNMWFTLVGEGIIDVAAQA